MDFSKVGDFFTGVTTKLERGITAMFGSSNERRVAQIGFVREKDGSSRIAAGSVVDRINQLEPTLEKLSDDELKESSAKFRARLDAGETLDDILPEAFAAVRESGKRYLKMRHYDVQLVGGYVLHSGMIAEMTTGEGKTLVATLPAYLNALAGKVHCVTVNDYLARRDMEWMGPVHIGLGLSVGAIQSNMPPAERQKQYACDITYGTNNEFGFDYLRDNMKPTKELQSQGPLDFALIDEIDNILIDEARTPLIISGPAHDDLEKYTKANNIVLQLKRDVHFEVKEKEHTCHLTDDGIRFAEQLAGVESFYTAGNMHWPHLLDNGLKAHFLYRKDVNYVVENGKVVIIDEFTGRKMEGRQWSDGLHQAVESKEGVKIKQESQTLATITLQNYFKLYKKLGGMTGTAMTEADEFLKIYGLDVLNIPTNRPMRRVNQQDLIYRTQDEKWNAVVDEVRTTHETGRPVLVGTVSIESSELLSRKLKRFGIQHNLLNAKFHEREAEIVAQAGRYGAVTISTNMAGRGTDIVLGGNPEHMAWDVLSKKFASRLDVPKSVWDETTEDIAEKEGMKVDGEKVADLGGLHVVGTERHDSRRIDLQLRGRAGRQGDPGSSRFFVSLDDDLMRIFMGEWVKNLLGTLGMQDGEAIESGMVTRRLEAAQKKREEHHFEVRKHLLEYDEVMDEQRKRVYSQRQRILDGANCRELVIDMIDEQIVHWVDHFLDRMYRWNMIAAWVQQEMRLELEPHSIRDMDKLQLLEYVRSEARRQGEDQIEERLMENLPEDDDEANWNWLSLSKWINQTYNLNTNDRELKKVGRSELHTYLYKRACESIDRFDLSAIDALIDEEWGAISLASWLHQQFTLVIDPKEFSRKEPEGVVELIRLRIENLYREKEIYFPVAVGMTRFMAQEQSSSADRYDREGLARWANGRFATDLELTDFRGTSRSDIEQTLLRRSERFLSQGDSVREIDERLSPAFGEQNGTDPTLRLVQDSTQLPEIVDWANGHFSAELSVDSLESASRDSATQLLLEAYDARYRPELNQAERSVILEILDTAWKEHLYFMDHLRQGVSLMSYAQKDPKVEYRREGMKAFADMWARIGQQVTATIFRLESQSPEFVGSLWEISAATHAPGEEASMPQQQQALPPGSPDAAYEPEPGAPQSTVEPIRNRGPRVGRNDPCPCGSGKKYKKCCGKA